MIAVVIVAAWGVVIDVLLCFILFRVLPTVPPFIALQDAVYEVLPMLGGIGGLVESLTYLINWPSCTEIATILTLVPLAFTPPLLRNWVLVPILDRVIGSWAGTSWLNALQGMQHRPFRIGQFPGPDEPNGYPINAEVLSWTSMAAYEQPHLLEPWVNGPHAEPTKGWGPSTGTRFVCAWHFSHMRFINPAGHMEPVLVGTDAWLMRHEDKTTKKGALVLTFRGSVPLEAFDWLTNVMGVKAPANDDGWAYGFYHTGFCKALGLGRELLQSPNFRMRSNPGQCGVLLNNRAGWQPLVARDMAVLTPFEVLVKKLAEELTKHPGDKLYITGHSLGGALAALFSAALMVPPPDQPDAGAALRELRTMLQDPDPKTTRLGAVITFAQPRIAGYKLNYLMQQALNRRLDESGRPGPRYWRVVNTNDVVPRVPAAVNRRFQHSDQLVMIRTNFQAPGVAPFHKLQEQDNVFYGTALCNNFVKLFWALRALRGRPPGWQQSLVTRLGALLGGVPLMAFVAAVYVLCMLLATWGTFGLYASVVHIDLLLVGAFLVVFMPVIAAGLVEHSMFDQWVAMKNSQPDHWSSTSTMGGS